MRTTLLVFELAGLLLMAGACGGSAHDPYFDQFLQQKKNRGVISILASDGTSKSVGIAYFWARSDLGLDPNETSFEGPCMLTVARAPTTAPMSTATPYLANPGTLTVTSQEGEVALEKQGDLPYFTYSSESGTERWHAGETITVRGSGAEVAAFSESFVMPEPVTLSPGLEGSQLDRSKDLEISWTGPGSGEPVNVYLHQSETREAAFARKIDLTCHVPPGPTTFAVPHRLLAKLAASTDVPAGNMTTSWLSISRDSHSAFDAGDFYVDLWGSSLDQPTTFASVR